MRSTTVRSVHGDPDHVRRPKLDLAGMQPGPQGDALGGGRVEQLGGAAHGAGGTVEGGQDPVTG